MQKTRVIGAFCLFCIIAAGSQRVIAQQNQDVLYLKNGWILRGKATGTADSVRITTRDGNTFVYHNNDIRELATDKKYKPRPDSLPYPRFFHIIETGALVTNVVESSFGGNLQNVSGNSFQTVHGLRLNRWVQWGLGIGADLYATQVFMPAFVTWRGDFIKKGRVLPFYFVDLGHSFNLTKNGGNSNLNQNNRTFSPGTMFAIGGGIKIRVGEKSFFLCSMGHHSQKSIIETPVSPTARNREELTYKRLALRVGFCF